MELLFNLLGKQQATWLKMQEVSIVTFTNEKDDSGTNTLKLPQKRSFFSTFIEHIKMILAIRSSTIDQ